MRPNLSHIFLDEITRRYFILNGFDGALTVLGIIIGSYVAQVTNPVAILGAGIGASVAMGLSGLFGAYMTERAESTQRLEKLEQAMLTNLQDSALAEASRRRILEAAIIDAVSPLLATLLSLMPYMLSVEGILNVGTAFVVALGIDLLVLAALGVYLGRVSHRSVLKYGLLTVVLGLVVGVITVWIVTLI